MDRIIDGFACILYKRKNKTPYQGSLLSEMRCNSMIENTNKNKPIKDLTGRPTFNNKSHLTHKYHQRFCTIKAALALMILMSSLHSISTEKNTKFFYTSKVQYLILRMLCNTCRIGRC